MANWQRKVDFSAYTEKYDEGELSIQDFVAFSIILSETGFLVRI